MERRRVGFLEVTAVHVTQSRLVLATLALLWTLPASATDLPTARPEQVGLSSERLHHIADALEADIEKGRIPGAVVLVARRGKIAYWEAFGRRRPGGPAMGKDDIFWIASMTKPFTTVAIMMLVEEGKILLNDPLSKYLPQFNQPQVAVEKAGPAAQPVVELVPARRPITIQDLLRHTAGLTSGQNQSLVKKQYEEVEPTFPGLSNAEVANRLSKLPLAYQPGTVWEYSRATDVLGRVVEVVSGKTLGQFFEERIYRPLQIKETYFSVPPEKWTRVAEPGPDPDTGKLPELLGVKTPRRFESGGGGLYSTAGDYLRLLQLLLNGGKLGDKRLLGPKTVAWMTADHLGTTISRAGPLYLPGPGYTFGLGFAVRESTGISALPGSTGEYNWGGSGGTFFWVDPKEELVGILMLQAPTLRFHYRWLVKTLVLQALVN